MPKQRTPKRAAIPFRNRNHTGLWIASYMLRCQVSGEDTSNPRRRCLAWKNTIILKAGDRETAYRKALRVGRGAGHSYRTAAGGRARWIFEGLVELLPVYEELADGSELYFSSYNRSVAAIQAMVPRKRDLAVFEDTPHDAG